MTNAVKTSAGPGTVGHVQQVIRTGSPSVFAVASALILFAGFCAGLLARDSGSDFTRSILYAGLFLAAALILGWYGERELKRLQHIAASEERTRLARELHDGVLAGRPVSDSRAD